MIVTETYMLGDRQFVRTYSDANRYVVRDGVEYEEANDPAEFGRTYTEGELIPIPEDEDIDDAEALQIILGGDES